jgi:hypothetical protein
MKNDKKNIPIRGRIRRKKLRTTIILIIDLSSCSKAHNLRRKTALLQITNHHNDIKYKIMNHFNLLTVHSAAKTVESHHR